MTVPTNTFQTYDTTGIREDLMDTIFNISPTEVPFISMIGKGKAKNTYVEWQIDSLADATEDNAVREGDDATNDAVVATSRVGNYTQLSDKVVQVSSTNQSVKAAGRKGEMSYQVAKRGKELKRDLEKMALSKNASAAGSGSAAARKSGGVGAWLETNTNHGASGGSGGFSSGIVSAPTNGDNRALSETLFKAMISSCWSEGGDPKYVFANSAQKQAISGFSGIATQYRESKGMSQAQIVAAADVYISDFGEHTVIADRFMPTDCIYGVDPEYWEMRYLQKMDTRDLAKTGHSDRKMLYVESTLCSKNEASSGGVFDLT